MNDAPLAYVTSGDASPLCTHMHAVWSDEEKQALQSGVLKHGLGAWEVIRCGDM